MKALFANLTRDDFGGSRRVRTATSRQRVYALFDEIQLAIHSGDRLQVEYLMTKLAEATAQDYRSAGRRDH